MYKLKLFSCAIFPLVQSTGGELFCYSYRVSFVCLFAGKWCPTRREWPSPADARAAANDTRRGVLYSSVFLGSPGEYNGTSLQDSSLSQCTVIASDLGMHCYQSPVIAGGVATVTTESVDVACQCLIHHLH